MTGAIRTFMHEHPEEFDPRGYLKLARSAMQTVIAERMSAFGQAGHAGDYEPIGLDAMAERYGREAAAV